MSECNVELVDEVWGLHEGGRAHLPLPTKQELARLGGKGAETTQRRARGLNAIHVSPLLDVGSSASGLTVMRRSKESLDAMEMRWEIV